MKRQLKTIHFTSFLQRTLFCVYSRLIGAAFYLYMKLDTPKILIANKNREMKFDYIFNIL